MKNNKSGFSLVELMVVVSIIAILASIAVPNFSKMSAKAKQTAARVELSGVYTAQQAFYAEYSVFHPNLPYVGYIPDGWALQTADATAGCPVTDLTTGPQNTRYYAVGFESNASYTPTGGTAISTTTAPSGGPAVICAGGGIGVTHYPGTVPGSRDSTLLANFKPGPGSNEFLAGAVGKITSSGSRVDKWSINQSKNLVNTQPGL